MTDSDLLIQEYGVPLPQRDSFESSEEYLRAVDLWNAGFFAYLNARFPVEEETDAPPADEAASSREEEPPQQGEDEERVEPQEPEAVQEILPPVREEPETEDRYPVGSYIDEAGNVWSQEGELLSPGTTPAMESAAAEPVTGEPAIDTALLLVDLLDALTGEDGMASDVDGLQQTVDEIRQELDHPLMTTSFQEYTVTEGLLLLLLLSAFVAACARMLREGFSWLR